MSFLPVDRNTLRHVNRSQNRAGAPAEQRAAALVKVVTFALAFVVTRTPGPIDAAAARA
jgi:hypothetical protein